jgi:hypothetical protein
MTTNLRRENLHALRRGRAAAYRSTGRGEEIDTWMTTRRCTQPNLRYRRRSREQIALPMGAACGAHERKLFFRRSHRNSVVSSCPSAARIENFASFDADPANQALTFSEVSMGPAGSLGTISGADASGIELHSVWATPQFSHRKTNCWPAVRLAQSTVSIELNSRCSSQIGQGRVQSKVAMLLAQKLIRTPRMLPSVRHCFPHPEVPNFRRF